jgi:hypothetical protein
MSNLPQGLHAENPEGGKPILRVGDHDLSDLPIAIAGPIVENQCPGIRNPLYIAWIPVMFEGPIHDPHGMVRIVHEGEAEAVGLPSGPAQSA